MKHKWNIEFENAGLVYPNGKEALKNINLKIEEGEIVAIIGLSGAGKTTLLKTINKLQDITSGKIFVGDRDPQIIEKYNTKKIKLKKEEEKLKDFEKNKKLTQKIIDSFKKDLNKEIEARKKANELRNKKIVSFKNDILKFEKNYKDTIATTKSKSIAAPYMRLKKEVLNKINKTNKKIIKKEKELSLIIEKTKITLEKLNDWENYKDDINKALKKRLEKRVDFFKKEYINAKKSKPFYDVKNLKGKKARNYKTNIGMVFQRYNLIYKATVLNNALSGRLAKMIWWRAFTGIWNKKDKKKALEALADVNMLEATYARAEDLSGGQMQRVALARTITQGARLYLADEPVGALDPIMAKSVMDSFLKINKKTGKTVLINLHHVDLALTYADRIIGVKAGEIVFDGHSKKVDLKVLKSIYGNKLEGFDDHELKEIMRKRKAVKGNE